ncbi:MAG: glycosyltransferase family 4 protein [Clostridiales bacterium]|nr:glycosyltransferase family 4 protein [Clostridiales bacterium]
MNLLMMTIYYPDECYDTVAALSKNGMQNQINNYQKAFIEGIEHCLENDETLQIVNSLPVGIYPLQYRKCFLKQTSYNHGRIQELGGINLPYLKQKMRKNRAVKSLKSWIDESPDNRTVLVYTLYLPYLQAIAEVKKQHPDFKAAVIVTDLPNEYGLPSGRKGLMKKLEQRMGEQQLKLCQQMDGFVLLTEAMAEVLPCTEKQTLIIEGLIRQNENQMIASSASETPFEVLYTGTLSPDLGIQELLDAFAAMPDVHLRICGGGIMAEQVRAFADKHDNIHYEGFVPQEKALALQAKANALINPRSPSGVFTRYSFPSKTLEYMRSGKPVLCYQLEGIPQDYDDYLCYIPSGGSQGIQQAVRDLQALTPEERANIGMKARSYVLQHKNPTAQCSKLVRWLRSF